MILLLIYAAVLALGVGAGYQIGLAKGQKQIEDLEEWADTLERQLHINEQIKEKREGK